MTELDIDFVRAQFPAFAEPSLAGHGIMAGGEQFYAARLLEGFRIIRPEHGVLRLSFLHYTHEDDVTRLIAALDAVI